MALGTTFRPDMKRNDIVRKALLDVHAVKPGDAPDGNALRIGVDALNSILREEDQDKSGNRRFLTALKTAHLFLELNRTIYTAAEGLAADIHELHNVHWRDSLGGELPLVLVSPAQWEDLNGRKDLGDPAKVYLRIHADPADHELLVWPATRTIGPSDAAASEVIGSDTLNYQCILPNTSSAATKPITGTDWTTYWQLGGSAGAAWVTATAYTSAASIRYLYKRPLFNFDTIDDDPDVPDGWANYLRWRLAVDISPTYNLPLDERNWLERRVKVAENLLFPSNEAKSTDLYGKALFF